MTSKKSHMYHLDESTETQLPPDFASTLESLTSYLINQSQHFALLLHYLMIEVGFSFHDEISASDNVSSIELIKESLHDSGAGYRFKYFVDPVRDVLSVLRIIIYGTKVTIVGAFAGQPQASFTMEDISFSNYIKNINCSEFPGRFKNIRELSRHFKDRVALPLLSHAKISLDLPLKTESFSALNNDAMLAVLKSIKDATTIVKLGQCSKAIRVIAEDNSIWKYLVCQDFQDQYRKIIDESNKENSSMIPWKEHYKRLFQKKKYEQNRANRTLVEHIPFIPDPFIPSRPRLPNARPYRNPFAPRFDPPFGPNFGPF